jgi:flagellar assembly protein FliH
MGVAIRTLSETVPEAPPTNTSSTDPGLPQMAALQSLTDALQDCSLQLEEATEIRVQNLRELQDLAVEIGIAVASRIVHEAIDANQFNVHALVQQAITACAVHNSGRVWLHPADVAVLRERLAAEPAIGWAGVEILEDHSLARGGCRVESPDQTVRYEVSAHLAEMRRHLLEGLDDAEIERRQTSGEGQRLRRHPDRRRTA